MSQEQPNVIANIIAQSNDVSAPVAEQSGFVSNIFTKINENKMYIYILIIVILLAGVGYYVYKNKQIQPKQQQQPQTQQNNYYVIDSEGNPIPVQETDIEAIKQQAIRQKMMMEQQRMMAQQQQQQQQQRLVHPGDDEEDDNIAEHELTKSEMEEINKNLENIKN